ncbi:MAG: FixH family protein, partial [Alphaproteobacteria bacterium]|nr:FixH family protein [Alphaproteobacteria bacterium]
ANSYVASQQFQTVHNDIARQVAAGWALNLSYDDGQVEFAALDGAGAPLALTGVSAFVRRPVGGHDDATIPLQLQDGRYIGAVALSAGVWDITVTTDATPLGAISFEHRVMAR